MSLGVFDRIEVRMSENVDLGSIAERGPENERALRIEIVMALIGHLTPFTIGKIESFKDMTILQRNEVEIVRDDGIRKKRRCAAAH